MLKVACGCFFLLIAGIMFFGGPPVEQQMLLNMGVARWLQPLYEIEPWTTIICVCLAVASFMLIKEY